MRPRLLDLFCCQGGAAVGYHRAGFDVVGVDIEPQPRGGDTIGYRYPLESTHAVDWNDCTGDGRRRRKHLPQGPMACLPGMRSGALGVAPSRRAAEPMVLSLWAAGGQASRISAWPVSSALARGPIRNEEGLRRSLAGRAEPVLSDGEPRWLRIRASNSGSAGAWTMPSARRGSPSSERRQARQRSVEPRTIDERRARCETPRGLYEVAAADSDARGPSSTARRCPR